MDRPTTTIKTPGGLAVEIYTYLTKREYNAAYKPLMESMEYKMVGDKPEANSIQAKLMLEFQENLLKAALVNIGGVKEGAYEKLLDLPTEEFDSVAKACQELLEKKS